MKKVGQPDNALEMTAGRATLLRQLHDGVADREGMAMAANWMRDIFFHRDERKKVEKEWPYKNLEDGTATDLRTQKAAAVWLANQCQITIQPAPIMSINETLEQEGLPPVALGANQRQPGGDHYRKHRIQHWDFVIGNRHSYLGGQVSKYLARWRDKNGVEDLEKSAHYLEKMIEVHEEKPSAIRPDRFCDELKLGNLERSIIVLLDMYEKSGDVDMLRLAQRFQRDLEKEARAAAAAAAGPQDI